MTGSKKRIYRLGVFLTLIPFFLTACKPHKTHEAAKKVTFEEAPLNVPGITPDAKASADKVLEWAMENTVEAYQKNGSRNAKWNLAAEDALKVWAQRLAYGVNVKGGEMAAVYSSKAIAAGCDDCLIRYINLRVGTNFALSTPSEIAFAFASVNTFLHDSKYHEFFKFMGAIRAAGAYRNLKDRPDEQILNCLDDSSKHLAAALEDSHFPLAEVDMAFQEFLPIIKKASDQKEMYERAEKVLLRKWGNEALTYLIRGEFYTDYAWYGRSGQTREKVTQAQWDLFYERLNIASEALQKGMELNPKDGRLPTKMINIVSGQGKGLPEMRKWFEAAMKADPNNYDACDALCYFLLPRWYGSRQQMIEFGRYCARSETWGGTVPLMLADAHYMYNKFDGAPDGSYWKQPDVWPDIKESYEKFFKINPKAVGWHYSYARYAYWCGQWEAFLAQSNLLGDDVNYNYFGGRADFDDMVKTAQANAKSK